MAYVDVDLLVAVVGGLGKETEAEGTLETSIYVADEDCVECLKDLQRFLRRDDPITRDAFRLLCSWNVPKKHILPILRTYRDEFMHAYNALKVLVFLTMPIDPTSEDRNLQVQYLRSMKEELMQEDVLNIVTSMLQGPLERHPKMNENDALLVQLVIAFFRNLLCISDDEGSTTYMNRNEELLLERLFGENVMELLLVMTQHCTQKPFSNDVGVFLEIFHRVFGKIKPYELVASARAADVASHAGDGQVDLARSVPEDGLESLIQAERGQRVKAWSAIPTRHSRFGGVYASKHHYGGIGTSIIRDNPRRSDAIYAPCGRVRAPSRKKLALESTYSSIRPGIARLLRDYADQFLESCYALFMEKLFADEIRHGIGLARFQEEDFVRFYTLARFFTGYLRAKLEYKLEQGEQERTDDGEDAKSKPEAGSPFAPISVTMTKSMFSKVINLWRETQDVPASHEEKNWKLQSAAQGLLVQMLHALQLAFLHGNPADKKAADALQRAMLFDDMRESGLLPLLSRSLKQFDYANQSNGDAADLIDGVFIALQTLDSLQERESGKLLVLRRKRKSRRKLSEAEPEQGVQSQQDPSVSPVQEENQLQKVAFDQKADQEKLRARQLIAGTADDTSDDEPETMEVELNVLKRFRQEFASPLVVSHYLRVMKEYKRNPVHVNDSISQFLSRLAFDCNLAPMLWQLRFLETVYQILVDKSIRSDERYSPLLLFCSKLVKGFLAHLMPPAALDPGLLEEEGGQSDEPSSAAERNAILERKAEVYASHLLFVEVMFWKHPRDATDVQQRYGWVLDMEMERRLRGTEVGGDLAVKGDALGEDELGSTSEQSEHEMLDDLPLNRKRKKSRRAHPVQDAVSFAKHHEEQIHMLFERYSGSEDVATLVAANLDGDFTTLDVAKKMRGMGLEIPDSALEEEHQPKKGKRGKFLPEQEEELARLFKEFEGSRAINKTIALKLGEGFTARMVARKIKEMGLGTSATTRKRKNLWASLSEDEACLEEDPSLSAQDKVTEGQPSTDLEDRDEPCGGADAEDASPLQAIPTEHESEPLEPSATELHTKALELLEQADLDLMTVKLLRRQLETHFKVDLGTRKDLIKETVSHFIQEKAKAQ